jgi:putative DNA methylase
MNNNEVKKLIEVALPIKEISAESVRDKSIRHGHISTLHLWWARRPLPVCRAVVFASLVPDPLDESCSPAFRDAVELLLGKKNNPGDPYKPYDDIPFTAAVDPMEDNLRNRLLMFIGKFSDRFIRDEKVGKKTPAKDQLSNSSLIKWDNKNNETIINKARKLIWVAHAPVHNTLKEFDVYYNAIRKAEEALYSTPDRHLNCEDVKGKETALRQAVDAFLDRMPKVFDPFAGGGAIPLEAARLGCRTFANDINPVAHIIEKGSLEFPQKYGKPIIYSKEEFITLYGEETLKSIPNENRVYEAGKPVGVRIENRLAFDVEFYAKKLLRMTEDEIGHLYPPDEEGNKPIAYYWARVGTCANPACKAEVPLLKQFYMVNKGVKKVHLKPIILGNKIEFKLKKGEIKEKGWINRGNMYCPCCGNITDVKTLKRQFWDGKIKERLLAVIWDSKSGKEYRLPRNIEQIILIDEEKIYRPMEPLPVSYTKAMAFCLWNFNQWGDIFSNRQLLSLTALTVMLSKIINLINTVYKNKNYSKALITYLSILMDRIAIANTAFGIWHTSRETLERPMGRQAIQMVFDYPESNPFCNSSGSAFNQTNWILRYIESESINSFYSACNNSSSGDISQFPTKYLDSVITDPPYYDAIAYADISDFFYIWLKQTLANEFPLNFAYPQTPKSEECTALKHHHNGSIAKAKLHFENKLKQILKVIEKQTKGIISIMFAHQSTEAWTTLCNSILNSNMNITASWANDTEMTGALKTNKAFLASSVTVSCRPSIKSGYGNYKEIESAIQLKVKEEVKLLYTLGFRGADLLTACFGQAVSEFGKYKRVEKADGTEVTVEELMQMARNSAFKAIVSDIDADDITRFYIGWLNLFGFSCTDHDDVRRITQIGLHIDVKELTSNNILVRNGNTENLTDRKTRTNASSKLGESDDCPTIDKVHKAMSLFAGDNREQLVAYISHHAPTAEHIIWRVLNSLVEILPHDIADYKEAAGLITNKDNLLREARRRKAPEPEERQKDLFDIKN